MRERGRERERERREDKYIIIFQHRSNIHKWTVIGSALLTDIDVGLPLNQKFHTHTLRGYSSTACMGRSGHGTSIRKLRCTMASTDTNSVCVYIYVRTRVYICECARNESKKNNKIQSQGKSNLVKQNLYTVKGKSAVLKTRIFSEYKLPKTRKCRQTEPANNTKHYI